MRIVIECLNAVELTEVLSALGQRGELTVRMGGRPGEELGSAGVPARPEQARRSPPKAVSGDGRGQKSMEHRLALGFTHAKRRCPSLTFEFYREHVDRLKEARLHTAGMNWSKYLAGVKFSTKPT
jgi:hypothetical protein